MQFASSPRSNPFVNVYVKESLLPRTKQSVMGCRVCQLILLTQYTELVIGRASKLTVGAAQKVNCLLRKK